LKRNVKIQSGLLNLQAMRLGINSVIALSNGIEGKNIDKLNLADNSISDYCMHAIKNIIKNSPHLKSLNLASNMISGEGLELFLDDLIENKEIKNLDLGVVEGSMRKNSLGIQGAVCISALLIKNKALQSLSISDNDLGPDGGECVGIALSQNDTLQVLKVAENDLKSEGAIPIIKSANYLTQLSLAKNFLKSDVGKPLAKLLKHSTFL
jgi:NLR family CARD domain-containing protein 3